MSTLEHTVHFFYSCIFISQTLGDNIKYNLGLHVVNFIFKHVDQYQIKLILNDTELNCDTNN